MLRMLNNNRGCFGGSPKPPDVTPPPTPPPVPTPQPSQVSAQTNEEVRRRQVEKLRYGLASTIKTKLSPVSGSLVDNNQQGAKVLG